MRTNLLSLKSLLVICLLAIVGGVESWADTYSYTFTSKVFSKTSTTSTDNLETQKLGDVSWTTSGIIPYLGSDATKGQQFGSAKKPADFSISTSGISGTITSVKVNASKGNQGSSTLTVSVGGNQFGKTETLTSSATDYTFEGSSSGEVKISVNSVSIAAYIKSIEITYTTTQSSVTAPTITPTSQEFDAPFTATIASTATGATVYYTLDGTDPTTSTTRQTYTSAGVAIPAATTTLKACASLNGENSDVVSATYTYTGAYANLAALKAVAESGKTYKVQLTDAIVTLTNGNNCYIQDATAGILYYKKSHGYSAGDKLNGVATVTYTVFEGTNEITSLEGDITKETGADIPCTEVSLSDVLTNTAQYDGMRVKVSVVVAKDVFTSNDDRSATVAYGDLELSLYKGIASSTYKDFRVNAYVNVTGYPYTYVKNGTSTPTLKVWTGDIEAVTDEPVNITDAQYATAYYADAFFMPAGATGYIAESNGNGGITLKETYAEGDLVPAKTALVLNAPKGKYDICLAESEDVAPTTNLLHGTTTEAITEVAGGPYKYYKLSYDSNGENLGFYYGETDGAEFINGAHKAFLAIPTTNQASMAKGFALNDLFKGSEVTGINHATVANKEQVIYDLNGRRINSLSGAAKGVYIVNGQKVLVK